MLFFKIGNAQFHTLKIPQLSNEVKEQQRLGVTDIIISYCSPTVNNRDVWNDTNVIPQEGEPIPWRAGANMNTTIEFSTDVIIEGMALKKGKYGFHIIPKSNNVYTLLFAHNNNLWGSYYLDIDKDITLSIDVNSEESPFSEKLDYEFFDWKANSVTIGLEWADRRIPFEVKVDINKTVVESFRSELRGINTYHWQAWNDAATWCLNHNTNIEEALQWAERSINGGYGGFAANKNFSNLNTKARLLKRLKKDKDFKAVVNDIESIYSSPGEAFQFGRELLNFKEYESALDFAIKARKKFSDTWFLAINEGLARYFLGNTEEAISIIEEVISKAPQHYHNRFNTVVKEMKAGIYKIPN
ncbi:hypothetical protein GCM10011444_18990 [Winogradskyella haliclonae]|uniref:DUF2911 domain-containing protein n=1 Tax=Winogradskyella haliclonae TaxID=2048558 RepID=A0ABQ2C068_9FLAO|nr:hypothetical protein GCM10011444_18990 [Winogradskyella haliclonae]